MGLDFKPRYTGPSPAKLLLGAALAFALVAGSYESGKQAAQAASPCTAAQLAKPPVVK